MPSVKRKRPPEKIVRANVTHEDLELHSSIEAKRPPPPLLFRIPTQNGSKNRNGATDPWGDEEPAIVDDLGDGPNFPTGAAVYNQLGFGQEWGAVSAALENGGSAPEDSPPVSLSGHDSEPETMKLVGMNNNNNNDSIKEETSALETSVTNVAGQTGDSTPLDRHYWNEEETNMLLELYVKNLQRFKERRHTGFAIWEEIASEIRNKVGVMVTGDQCHSKLRNMKRTFVRTTSRVLNSSGGSNITSEMLQQAGCSILIKGTGGSQQKVNIPPEVVELFISSVQSGNGKDGDVSEYSENPSPPSSTVTSTSHLQQQQQQQALDDVTLSSGGGIHATSFFKKEPKDSFVADSPYSSLSSNKTSPIPPFIFDSTVPVTSSSINVSRNILPSSSSVNSGKTGLHNSVPNCNKSDADSETDRLHAILSSANNAIASVSTITGKSASSTLPTSATYGSLPPALTNGDHKAAKFGGPPKSEDRHHTATTFGTRSAPSPAGSGGDLCTYLSQKSDCTCKNAICTELSTLLKALNGQVDRQNSMFAELDRKNSERHREVMKCITSLADAVRSLNKSLIG